MNLYESNPAQGRTPLGKTNQNVPSGSFIRAHSRSKNTPLHAPKFMWKKIQHREAQKRGKKLQYTDISKAKKELYRCIRGTPGNITLVRRKAKDQYEFLNFSPKQQNACGQALNNCRIQFSFNGVQQENKQLVNNLPTAFQYTFNQ